MEPERQCKSGMDGGLPAAVRISPLLHLKTDEILSNRWGPPQRESERQKAIHTFEHSWPSKILDDTRTHLEEDAIALRVFDLLREGNTPAEVREALRIKDNVYNAARKTISRRMSDLFEGWRTVAKLDMPGRYETESDHA